MTDWTPPSTWEERLKYSLVPPGWYIRYRVWKERRKGEAELGLVPFLVDRRRAALDVGANKGVWSHVLARHCPQVFAFEPNPKPFAVLRRCAAANVKARQIAASDADGSAEFRIPRGRKGYSNQRGSLNAGITGTDFGAIQVEARRLDGLDLPPVGFIKIDVEGHEAEVLAGAAALIRRDRPTLVIELEEIHTGIPIETMIANVERLGYRAHVLLHGRLQSFRQLDPVRNHRQPAHRRDYVFNFIFLPD